ncbi:MAG: ABC transporter permease [Pigmentiphaga sp.]|jgi:sulfonate transport system permease protein|uniref:ABC transporter permease n=1 Tax=unclassified Pigmentiphaga TaxID=2626614 RepID=UPI0030CB1EBD
MASHTDARLDAIAVPASTPRPRPSRAWRAALLPLLLPALALCAWQLAASQGWMAPQILPAPEQVWASFVELLENGDIAANFAVSLHRIGMGFLLGAALGLATGIALGVSNTARDYLDPLLRALFAIPSIGWIPILILVFGIAETLKILIIAKAVFVPIVIHTAQGIRDIPKTHLETARVLRLRPWTRFIRVIAPASLGPVFSGVRLGLGHAFIALIVVEMLAATEGIGYMMVWGRKQFQTDIVIVGMIVVGLAGFALDRALLAIEQILNRKVPPHG